MLFNSPTFDNINFNGGSLSSDGGAILLLRFLSKQKLINEFNRLPFNDLRSVPLYSNQDILTQLIAKGLLGYFNQADQKVLINDPLLSKHFTACSQPTISRFFDRVTDHTNIVLKEILTKYACDHVNRYVEAPIIDADSTLCETYGSQQASSYIHHYQSIGYHPLVINEFNSKVLLSARLRSGNSYSSNGIIEELQTIFPFLYNRGNIRFRGDSAFYDTKLLEYLEDNEITYYIRAKGFKALHREIMADMVIKDIQPEEYTAFHPYYGEMRYTIGFSGKERRILYKAYYVENNGQMSLLPTIYAIVTNDEDISPYDGMSFYEARGTSENYTKELKTDFDAVHLSHSDFTANEMQFLISALSYNLFHFFQNTILEDTDLTITANTFRMMYQKVAVKVISHARKLILSFSSAYNNSRRFMHYWNKVLLL